MVNIYFGKADPSQEITTDLFQHNGNYYYFKLELEKDQFVIRDTCNRYVPFELDTAKEMVRAVTYVHERNELSKSADSWLDKNLRSLGKYYGIENHAGY